MSVLRMIDGFGESPVRAGLGIEPEKSAGSIEVDLLSRVDAIVRQIDGGHGIDAVLQCISAAIAEASPWPMCGVELFRPDNLRLITWASTGFHPGAAEVFDTWPAYGYPSDNAMRRNRVIIIPDVAKAVEYPHTRSEAIRTGYRSAIYVPIRLTDYWAVLTVALPDAHEFTAAELAQVGTIATLTAVTLESAVKTQELHADGSISVRSNVDLERHADLERRAAAQDRLLGLQVSGATLDEIASGVSSLLSLPVLLVDRFHQALAAAQMGTEHTSDVLAWLSAQHLDRTQGRGVTHVSEGLRNVMIGHANVGSERVGSLIVVLPSGSQPHPVMLQTLELACEHVALALNRQRATIDAEVRMRQAFGEALGSLGNNGLSLSQAAAILGISEETPHRVMRVHPEGLKRSLSAHDSFEIAELLTQKLAQIGLWSVVAPVGGVDFVVVLPDQEQRRGMPAPAQVVRTGLRDALGALLRIPASHVAIGIGTGNVGTGVDGLDRSHREATRALEVARWVEGDDAERHIGEVGSYAVLAAGPAGTSSDRQMFINRHLEPLREYDRLHNAGLIETLQTYFETVGNVQRTAEKLFLHLSTVRYRLKRIEEIAAISLRHEEDRLCLQLALRLARFSQPD